MPPTPVVRPFSPSDSLQELTHLIHSAYARLGAMGLNYTAVDQTVAVTSRRISGGHCLVTEENGTLTGTIVVHPTYTDNDCEYFTRKGVAAAHQFAVQPQLQGKGIGKALLAGAERWAKDHGFDELAMDTAEQARHLVELYGRLGYHPVGHVQWPGKVYRSVVLSKQLL